MPVVHVKEVTGREGQVNLDSDVVYEKRWQVLTSLASDGPSVVLAAPGVPAIGDYYRQFDGAGLLVQIDLTVAAAEKRCVQDDPENPLNWTVIVRYVGKSSPLAEPAEVEYGNTRYQRSVLVDSEGTLVKNSAGDPFEAGIQVDETRFTLVIAKNVLTWDPVDAMAYLETLNLTPFLQGVHGSGFDPGTVKLTGLGATRVRRNNNENFYWKRRAEFDIKPDGWDLRVYDQGFREKVGGELVAILDNRGVPASSPQFLNGTGGKLVSPAAPVRLTFKPYVRKDWSLLGMEY